MLRALTLILGLGLALPALADIAPPPGQPAEAPPDKDNPGPPDDPAEPPPQPEASSPDPEGPPDLSEPVDVDDPTGVAATLDDLVWPFIKTMLMLCLVLGLVYLTLNKGLGKLMARTQAGKRIKVIERITLDQRRAIFLVEVDGEEILLAAGEGGVVRLERDKPAQPQQFDIGARAPGQPPPVTGVRASGERVSLADDDESEGSAA